jgi:hypothetical protein
VYLYEQLKKECRIAGYGNLSETDGFLRPLFLVGDRKEGTTVSSRQGVPEESRIHGRVCIVRNLLETQGFGEWAASVCLVICVHPKERVSQESLPAMAPYILIETVDETEMAQVMNLVQYEFDRCDIWAEQIQNLLATGADMEKILKVTSDFLQNPLMVMGLDFSLVAEAGSQNLKRQARLFREDGLNVDYMNALLQDEGYRSLENTRKTALFPAYISGCRSLNRNLYIEGKPTHRLVLTECDTPLEKGDVMILDALSSRLEYLLSHAPS